MDLLITAKNFVCPSLFMAEKLQHIGSKTWVYQFNRVRDDELAKKYGAFHGAELPYVFNTHDEWLPTNQHLESLLYQRKRIVEQQQKTHPL